MLFKQMGELINVSCLNRSWIDEDNIAAHDQKHTLTDTCCILGISDVIVEWVQGVWENDFLDVPSLPLELEEFIRNRIQMSSSLSELHDALKPCAEGHEVPSGQGLWSILSDNNVTVKNVVAFLFLLINKAQTRTSKVDEKITGSIASAVYFLLLRVSGSRAYKVFNNGVFDKAMSMLTVLAPAPVVDTGGKKKRQKGMPGRSQSKRRRVQQEVEPATSDEEDNEDSEEVLGPQEMHQLNSARIGLLKDFVALLKSYQLDDAGAVHAMQLLIRLTTQDPNTFDGVFNENREVGDMKNIPELAFTGLRLMYMTDRSDQLEIITSMLRQLMPNVLMLFGQNSNSVAQTISQSLLLIRDYTVTFVSQLMRKQIDGVMTIMRTFLQNLCIKVPDKTDYRAKVSQAILTIIHEMPVVDYASFVQWIVKYSKNAKIPYRVFALDLISGILEQRIRFDSVDSLPVDLRPFVTHQRLLEVVVERCSDISPSVRSRAISAFMNCSLSKDPLIVNAICSIVTPRTVARPVANHFVRTPGGPGDPLPTPQTESAAAEGATTGAPVSLENNERTIEQEPNPSNMDVQEPEPRTLMNPVELTPAVDDISLTDNSGVVSMLRRRCSDDKINVRRSALAAMETVIRLEGHSFNPLNLKVIEEHCRDMALSVRKQAVQSLTTLLHEFPDSPAIQRAWLGGLLPMVSDGEATVQAKCLELLEETIFHHIVPYQSESSAAQLLVWSLLKIIASPENMDFRRFLQKACQHWGKVGSIPKNLIQSIKSHIGTENNEAVWLLLSEVAAYLPKFKTDFLLDYWDTNAKQQQPTEATQSVLIRVITVLGRVAKNIASEKASSILDDLKQMVVRFSCPPDLTTAIIIALNKIANTDAGLKEQLQEWFGDVLKICDQYLSSIILSENQDLIVIDEERLVQHLFTLGEIALLCPQKTPKRVHMLVQSVIAAPTITPNDTNSDCVSGTQSSQGSVQVLSQFRGSNMSPRVRAVAFVSLGKLCLQNEDVAKACVPALARELETSPDVAVRNNVVIILCDLCIRYTLLVDRYIKCISACLRDDSELIRRQTLILLTHLLQEDYIKWKDSLFFRFVLSTVDDVQSVREFAHFSLVHILVQRHPGLYFNHFIESIFYFNSYSKHPTYNNFTETAREVKRFSLKGEANTEKRMTIYRFVLENMNDGHRFQVMGKLVQEVLVSFVDEIIPLDSESSLVLQDALRCLASKEIKLAMLRSKPNDDMVENEEEVAAALVTAAKKTIISQVMKKTVMESTVPVMIALKHMLESHNSPILRDFMVYLRELMKDYKNEVKEVLGTDKQLANEIEFDLRKFEEDQENFQKKKQFPVPAAGNPMTPVMVASLQGTPTLQNPRLSRGGTPTTPTAPPLTQPGTRRMSLATAAILNSARMAMSQAGKMAERRKTMQRLEANDMETEEAVESDRMVQDNVESDVEPVTRHADFARPTPRSTQRVAQLRTKNAMRAISTPAAPSSFSNVTFCLGDNNVSMITPALAIRSSMRQKLKGLVSDSSDELDDITDSARAQNRKSRAKATDPLPRLSRLSLGSSEERASAGANSEMGVQENDENLPRRRRRTRQTNAPTNDEEETTPVEKKESTGRRRKTKSK